MNYPVHATVQMATVEITVHVSSQYALFCCILLHMLGLQSIKSIYPMFLGQTLHWLGCHQYIYAAPFGELKVKQSIFE